MDNEPQIFRNWSGYLKNRQAMSSSVVFNRINWQNWTTAHANLFGIILWHYQTTNSLKFKYSKLMKKNGYSRTHNYRLMKALLDKSFILREGNGHYTINPDYSVLIDKMSQVMKQLDFVSTQAEGGVRCRDIV